MTSVFAIQTVHEVGIGGQITGVASDGTSTEETLERGRIQVWGNGTVGGLFPAHAQIGMRVQYVAWSLTAAMTPTVAINLVDDAGVVYLVDSTAAASGVKRYGSEGLFIPPGWSLQVTSTQVCSALGRVCVNAFRGWDRTWTGVIGGESRV